MKMVQAKFLQVNDGFGYSITGQQLRAARQDGRAGLVEQLERLFDCLWPVVGRWFQWL
jgi:hypothetical protein